MHRRTLLVVLLSCEALWGRWPARAFAQPSSPIVFESTWDTATGTSADAVTDGGRWPGYWEYNGGTNVQLLSVVPNGINGHHALRIEQRGQRFAANLQVDDFLPPSRDYYLRYYMRNDDTSTAGDHVVTVDTRQYANLTFLRKFSGNSGWTFVTSLYGCGYTYPIGHWGPTMRMTRGAWYRFEYFVDYIDATHVQVHPRVYDAAGKLILTDADFRQSDFGSTRWNGRADWTLASYYAAGHSFCVEPGWVNDFGIGNNGQQGASDTELAWYISAVEIRSDRWPGPVTRVGSAPSSDGGLAAGYPGDVGIDRDPDVLFVEQFEESTLASVFSRWTDVSNGSRMTLGDDVPPRSSGKQSLEIWWIGGGISDGGHLYRRLSPGIDNTVFVRYYVKYPSAGVYRHAGVWMGGHNPPRSSPDPQAGTKPSGRDRFIAAAEQTPFRPRFDHYDYWMDMRPSADGQYWGNFLLDNAAVRAPIGVWTCVEHMVSLNDISASNGEHALWIDGSEVSHVGQGFPNGVWSGGTFTQTSGGQPFEGIRWRADPALNLNWLWLLNYSPNAPRGSSGSVKFDHVVAARSYVGCLST